MRAPFIGRRMEMEAVIARLKAAISESGGLIAVRGEAGVGKSRFVEEIAAQARLLGFRILSGRGDELQRSVPYGVMRGALAEALAGERSGRNDELARQVSVALGLEAPGDASPETASAAYASADLLLRAWAASRPILLTIDDAHDADHDSLVALGVLEQAVRHYACAVLVSSRWPLPEANRDLDVLLQRIDGDSGLVIDLGPLDADDARALSSSLLDGVPDQSLDSFLWESSRGNPFFLEEGVRWLCEDGAVETSAGTARLVGGAALRPATHRESVLRRVLRLGRDGTRVAEVVSVLSRLTLDRMSIVEAVTGLDAAAAGAAFDALVRAGVLDESAGVYSFTHPLLRETLYWDIGPAERRRMHRVIGAELARRAREGDDILELAYHVGESAEPGDAAAGAILVQAGDASSTAPRSAAAWYGKALQVLPADAPERGRVLYRRSRAHYLAWELEDAAAAGREAIRLLPPGRQHDRAAGIVVGSLAYLGRFDEALALSDQLLDPAAESEASRVHTQRASLLLYSNRLADAEAEARVALAKAGDERGSQSLAIGVLCAVAAVRGDVTAVRRLAREQVEAARSVSEGALLVALPNAASQLALCGEVPLADEYVAEARGLIERLGTVAFAANLDLAEVWLHWLRGEWDDALSRTHAAALHPEMHTVTGDALRAIEAALLVERGEYAQARSLAAREPVMLADQAVFAWATSGADLAAGQLDTARASLETALDHEREAGRRVITHLLLDRLVDIASAAGDARAVERSVAELEALAAGTDSNWVRSVAWRAAATAAGDAEKLRSALDAAEANGLVFQAALCRYQLGRLGDGEQLAPALEVFRRLGAQLWRQRTTAEMRRQGLRIPRTKRARPGVLTETEERVARLVGQGMSSRQIANALFLSEKTVEIYLSRIYAKTGYHNRLELALAARLGQLDEAAPAAG